MRTPGFDYRLALPITISLLMFCSPTAATESTTSIDLLIVAGQSNATGFDADPTKLGTNALDALIRFRFRVGDPPPDDRDSISSQTEWTVLAAQSLGKPGPKSESRQYGNFANPRGGFGPEISFARKLKQRDQQLGPPPGNAVETGDATDGVEHDLACADAESTGHRRVA